MGKSHTLRQREANERLLLFEAKERADVAYLLDVLRRNPRLRPMAARLQRRSHGRKGVGSH
jgi:hypothetical protein